MSRSTVAGTLVVRIMGGLGNQLFQYAFGRTLSLRLGLDLALDLRAYEHDATPRYGLDAFRIQARRATEAERTRLRGGQSFLSRLLHRPWTPPATYVRERREFTYDPEWLPTGEAYLDGYWQSERYFLEQEALLRRELTPARDADPRDQALARSLASEESVSVHVRRGDYVTHERMRAFFGEFSPEFYAAAAAAVVARVPSPRFHLFSDDPEWTRENVRLPGPTDLVSDGVRGPEAELFLMARCRHHIATNSTYSWWGAWLGRRPDGVTVGPARWIRADAPAPDVIPEWWVTV